MLGAGLTLMVIAGRFAIARLFLGHAAESAEATIDLAATLLLVAATLFIADGVQTIMAGSLRGMKDTRIPLLFAAIGYWLIGFPAAWELAFRADLGAVGVWIGLSLGSLVYAVLLVLRFRRLANRFALRMKVDEVEPNVDRAALLAGAQFVDAFRIAVEGGTLDARNAAQRMMGRSPRWIEALLSLRNALVAPFGLKTSGARRESRRRPDRHLSGPERNAGSSGCRI